MLKFISVPHFIINLNFLTVAEKLLLSAIIAFTKKGEHSTHVSNKALGKQLALSDQTISRGLSKLNKKNLIEVSSGELYRRDIKLTDQLKDMI